MTWFKVGDELTFHPRVLRAGNAAMGLWLRAGTWCSEHLTDGWIAHDDARALGSAAEIKKLVAVGLWYPQDRGAEKGYQFHLWATNGLGDKRQPTRAEVEAERERTRVRVEKWRKKKVGEGEPPPEVSAGNGDVTRYETGYTGVGNEAPTHTAPTRPDPTRPDLPPTEEETISRPTAPKIVVTEGEFARWWDTYPRHEAKLKARDAYKAARLKGATQEQLIAGAQRYRDDPNREEGFTTLPTTWLNQGRWDDDPLPARTDTRSKPSGPVAPPLKVVN